MTRERWGTFSVIDHRNPSAFVPEVLLYDRLVIPVPFSDSDRERWEREGWDPGLLDRRIKTLGDLAVKAVWDEARQLTFDRRMRQLESVRFDIKNAVQEVKDDVSYQMTRAILAELKSNDLPDGISHVVVVPAYQSQKDFQADFLIEEESDDEALLGLLLGQKIAVPAAQNDPEDALLSAIELAKSEKFKQKRRDLYKWQEDVIVTGIDPKKAIVEMDELINDYNECVIRAVRNVYYKYAFTLAGIAVTALSGTLANPLVSAGALLTLVKFATFDRKPVVNASESAPAAMFHEANRIGKWKWY